jgi:transcriptional regulator with XRE-family HTH domain
MGSPQKTEFGKICRELRVQNRYKQREVANGIGVKLSTVGNMESSPFRVIGLDRVARIAEFYALPPDRAAELRKAWEGTELSAYGEKRRKNWQRQDRLRSKSKHFDRVFRSLAEVLGVCIEALHELYPGRVCKCSFDEDEPCEVCMALENLGLETFTTIEKTSASIAALQTRLEEARESTPENGATP